MIKDNFRYKQDVKDAFFDYIDEWFEYSDEFWDNSERAMAEFFDSALENDRISGIRSGSYYCSSEDARKALYLDGFRYLSGMIEIGFTYPEMNTGDIRIVTNETLGEMIQKGHFEYLDCIIRLYLAYVVFRDIEEELKERFEELIGMENRED